MTTPDTFYQSPDSYTVLKRPLFLPLLSRLFESAITTTLPKPSRLPFGLENVGLELEGMRKNEEAEIDRLPIDLLANIFVLLTCFKDLAQASSVCRKWKQGVKQSLARREKLSFAGWTMDDDSITRLVLPAYNLKELDISKSRWGCQITDNGLYQLSSAKCVSNLSSISLWGMAAITDKGVVQLISRATSLQHLNIGGTFITDESLFAIANSCPHLKSIILWGCRHVTESGLLALVNKCRKLGSINAWGAMFAAGCFLLETLHVQSFSSYSSISSVDRLF